MLNINEIFFSAQGEGSRVGFPSVFIRLSGCSAQCPYCDTKDSWKNGRFQSEKEILGIVDTFKIKYKNFQIVITGGEPFEQDVKPLVTALKNREFFVAVETNGKHFYESAIDWYAVSPKDVLDYQINRDLQKKINEIKLVVNENLTVDILKGIRKIDNQFPIYLQPDFFDQNNYKNTYAFYLECLQAEIENVRLGFQLHRLYEID